MLQHGAGTWTQPGYEAMPYTKSLHTYECIPSQMNAMTGSQTSPLYCSHSSSVLHCRLLITQLARRPALVLGPIFNGWRSIRCAQKLLVRVEVRVWVRVHELLAIPTESVSSPFGFLLEFVGGWHSGKFG